MSNKVFPVCVIGGGSAGVMACLRTVLNNDECLIFPGTPKNKKRSRAFWVSKIENMPSHFSFKKGIENPNKEVIEWIKQSPFSENLFFKKNEGVEKISKNSEGLFELVSSKGEVYLSRYVILCTGGTGPGPRDVTPLALGEHLNPELPGLGEWLRSESSVYTKTAWLSRMGGGLIGRALVITLPGSLQAMKECFGIFSEGLPKAIMMIEKQGRKGRL